MNLLSSISIPVVMVGGDLRVRRFTEPARKTMNLLPGDVGRPLTDLNVATVVPDLDRIISDVIDTVQPYEREVRDRDGRWHMMRVHPYRTAQNKIDGAVIVLVDVDMFHRSQEALQRTTAQLALQGQLIELSQDAVIVRDANNAVLSWNRGAEDMYGWTVDEARGKTLDQLLRTDTAAWAALNDRLDKEGRWEGELRQVHKDGTPIIVHSREVLVRADDGTRTAVLSIKRNQTELRRMVEALKDADRRKDEFLAMLAHELRNPLGPIRNAVGIMALAGGDPTSVALARDMLERQVGQLGRIIDDLVDISRIVERKISLEKDTVELRKIVEVALETCRSQVEGREQRLTVSLPAEPSYLYGDQVRLSQVLINLLNNSALYGPGARSRSGRARSRRRENARCRLARGCRAPRPRLRDRNLLRAAAACVRCLHAGRRQRSSWRVGCRALYRAEPRRDARWRCAGLERWAGKGQRIRGPAAARRAAAGVRADRTRRSPAGNRDAAACPRRG
jgi:two-component system CheB/CheR fusion protein